MTAINMKSKPKFDRKRVEGILKAENEFIRNLYGILTLPTTNATLDDHVQIETATKRPILHSKTTRAKSLTDLQARIDKLKNKNSMMYKDKIQEKNLKSRLKKKLKREIRNKQSKVKKGNVPAIKIENGGNDTAKPKGTKGGKMVFSKIDFEGLGKQKQKKAVEKDPKKLLEQVKQVNEKVAHLNAIGEAERAIEIRDRTAWKNALAKAEGVKVKDDPTLLKKSIKKMDLKKKSSKKKWDARLEGVQRAKDERQKKRTENIEKRKKENKIGKLKKAAKKGRIIPGF